jgi:hypothetical protein
MPGPTPTTGTFGFLYDWRTWALSAVIAALAAGAGYFWPH